MDFCPLIYESNDQPGRPDPGFENSTVPQLFRTLRDFADPAELRQLQSHDRQRLCSDTDRRLPVLSPAGLITQRMLP